MGEQGARAVKNGKAFEEKTNLLLRLETDNISLKFEGISVFHQSEFYKEYEINWKVYFSKKLIPDEVVVNENNKTIYVIEKKYKERAGSDDEKLNSCLQKKRLYAKMIKDYFDNEYSFKMYYLLNDYYNQPKYKDTFDFMSKSKVKHFFGEIPYKEFGF